MEGVTRPQLSLLSLFGIMTAAAVAVRVWPSICGPVRYLVHEGHWGILAIVAVMIILLSVGIVKAFR